MKPYLYDSECRVELERVEKDFQKLYRRRFSESVSSSSISILTRIDDREADQLSLRLAAEGKTLLRIDCDADLSEELRPISMDGALMEGNQETHIRVAWLRHFSEDAMTADKADLEAATYTRRQTIAYGQTVLELADYVVNGNCSAFTRFAQLIAARRVGFLVAPTRIDFPKKEKWSIAKPIGTHWVETKPGDLVGIMPRPLGDFPSGKVEKVPYIIQDLERFDYELRCFVIGGELICYSVHGCHSAKSLWTDKDEILVSKYVPTLELKSLILRYCEATSSDLCAIDLLSTEEGFVFLECNMTFDWLYYEAKVGTNEVTESISNYLRELEDACNNNHRSLSAN